MLKSRVIVILEDVIAVLKNCNEYGGMCDVLENFEYINKISSEERNYIIKLLQRNKPTTKNMYKEFTDNIFWTKSPNGIGVYWWNPMFEYNETIQIRIDYLKAVIENLK